MAITSAIVGATAAIAATAVSIAAAQEQHSQAAANAKMQADQMNYNKRLELREERRVEEETAENARRQRAAAMDLQASQRAMLGKSGAAMTSGSPLAVLGLSAADEELKIQDIHRGGYIEAAQHRTQATMYGYQAAVAKAQAPSSSSLGLSIAGSIASGTGALASIGLSSASAKKNGVGNWWF